jgi:surface antigen
MMRRAVVGLGIANFVLVTPLTSAHGGSHADAYAALADRHRGRAAQAVQQALETRRSGDQYRWAEGARTHGSVVPLRTYKSVSGHYCREFRELVVVDGGPRIERQAIACRDGDGVWHLVRS